MLTPPSGPLTFADVARTIRSLPKPREIVAGVHVHNAETCADTNAALSHDWRKSHAYCTVVPERPFWVGVDTELDSAHYRVTYQDGHTVIVAYRQPKP